MTSLHQASGPRLYNHFEIKAGDPILDPDVALALDLSAAGTIGAPIQSQELKSATGNLPLTGAPGWGALSPAD